MGGIELDPASSYAANKRVKAERFFSKEQNGLRQSWAALSLFMNHPYGKEENPLWSDKIISEFATGKVEQACMLCYAATSEIWCWRLLSMPVCFIKPRLKFVTPEGNTVGGGTKGSIVVYFGENVGKFQRIFSGRILGSEYSGLVRL